MKAAVVDEAADELLTVLDADACLFSKAREREEPCGDRTQKIRPKLMWTPNFTRSTNGPTAMAGTTAANPVSTSKCVSRHVLNEAFAERRGESTGQGGCQ
ncbi:MAG: hypothetical protein ACSLFF_00895 [Solirubrobacterales bacterium]